MAIIKGGEGAAFHLKRGQQVRIVNAHGSQVVDLFTFGCRPFLSNGPPAMQIQYVRIISLVSAPGRAMRAA